MAIKQLGAAPTNPQDAVPKSYVDTETTRAQVAEALAALKANNLSDLASVSTARTNLNLTLSCLSTALPSNLVAGQRVYVTDLAQEWLFNGAVWVSIGNVGGWTAYTPTWSSAATAPNIGNGTLIGAWNRAGRAITFRVALNAGTTTTFGTGYYSLSLPVTAPVGFTQIVPGAVMHGGARRQLSWQIFSGGSVLLLGFGLLPTDTDLFDATHPFTLAAGDTILAQGTYESAT